ncbi:MAG: hypothetical protein H7144_02900 [Burkholderiales bacterium]|nr:hypothetical protein [Phycisphaerae bacterium]
MTPDLATTDPALPKPAVPDRTMADCTTPDQSRHDRRVIIVAALIFSALSAWMAIASRGFLEADGITHYLARRFAIGQPFHMVGVWSRPLCVLLYSIPAKFAGLTGTRLMSLALVLVMLWMTLKVAARLNIARPALVALFLLTQPLLFAHSFSELTEIPFALLMIAAMWAYASRSFVILALLASFSPLARPEGFGLILMVALALGAHRKLWWLALLPIGVITWCYAGWHVYGGPMEYPWYTWLRHNWPYSADSMYGQGKAWWTKPGWFIAILPAVIGPMAFPLIWIGAVRLCAAASDHHFNRLRRFFSDHLFRSRVLIVLVPLGVLIAHSALWTLGKMASNGEPRYMLIAAPFWALLAAAGWQRVCELINIRQPLRWTALGAAVVVAANFAYPAFPLGEQDDDRIAADVSRWLDAHAELRQNYPRFAAALPHLFMYRDLDRLDTARVVDSSRTVAANPPPGVIMIWHDVYSTSNSNEEYCITEDLLLSNHWQPIHEIRRGRNVAIIFLSPR